MRDVTQIATATNLDIDATLDLARRWRGRAVVQRTLALAAPACRLTSTVRSTNGPSATSPIGSRRRRCARTRPKAAAYAGQMATGVWALRGMRTRAAFGAALLVPDRSYVAEREGSYVRRWARALTLVRPSRSASCARRSER